MPSSPLPSGHVTFLLTDIEGSTRLAAALGPAFAELMALHHSTVEEVVRSGGGSVVNTTGDGFLAAFSDARDAVRCALELQRAMRAARWPQGARVRVRIGLHAGPAEPHGDTYATVLVHQAARVCAAGHGGQVLATPAALHGVEGSDGWRRESLGRHLVRDFEDLVELVQVSDPDAVARFPPVRTIDRGRRLLPTPASALVGRRDDLRTITEGLLSGQRRLTTLVGTGGVGKTRLALECAQLTADRFADGAWFVSLEAVADPATVGQAVAAALGVPGHPDGFTAALAGWLAPGRQLLVVDNWEHVLEAADLVAELLRACPRLVVLATSQRRLRLEAEHVVTVEPLDVPAAGADDELDIALTDAAVLFARRAERIAPFAIDRRTAPAVARICRAVGGVPLALELCAGRIDELSVDELADAVDEQLLHLDGASRDTSVRHRSVHAMVDWSCRLLGAREARLLRSLGIFTGAFTAEDVVAISPGWAVGDVGTALEELVDRSLVQRADALTGELRLLDTVRQFARSALADAGEHPGAADALLGWLAELTRDERSDDPVLASRPVSTSLGAALEWGLLSDGSALTAARVAGSVFWVWESIGALEEAIRWLELAATAAEADRELWAYIVVGLAWITFRHDDYPRGRSLALAVRDEPGARPQDRGLALHLLALLAVEDGEDDVAVAHADQGLALYAEVGEVRMAASLHVPLALALSTAHPEEALAVVHEGLAMEAEGSGGAHRVRMLRILSNHHLALDDNDEAERFLLEAERIARRPGGQINLPATLDLLTSLHLQRGDLLAARRAVLEAQEVAARISPSVLAVVRTTAVEVAHREDGPGHVEQVFPHGRPQLGFLARHAVATATLCAARADWEGCALAAALARELLPSAGFPPAWQRQRVDDLLERSARVGHDVPDRATALARDPDAAADALVRLAAGDGTLLASLPA